MASSSTRSTVNEDNLRHYYKIAFTRLYDAGLNRDAASVTTHFAELLDMGKAQLFATLKPLLLPDRSNVEKYKAELKVTVDLETSDGKIRRSEKICQAGNAFADAGACLFQAGREDEAGRFCEWGE